MCVCVCARARARTHVAGREQVAGTHLALIEAPPCSPSQEAEPRGPRALPQSTDFSKGSPCMEGKQASERLCQEELLLCLARYSDIYLYINTPASRRFQSALFQKILSFIFMTWS